MGKLFILPCLSSTCTNLCLGSQALGLCKFKGPSTQTLRTGECDVAFTPDGSMAADFLTK